MSVSYTDDHGNSLTLAAPWNGQLLIFTTEAGIEPTPLQARDLARRVLVWAAQREQGVQAPTSLSR